jgi:hypothetical protein
MLCRNNDFAEFLHLKGHMDDDMYIQSTFGEVESSVAGSLRKYLGIESRSEIKTNSQAREKFKSLSEEFTRWKQGRQS